MPAVSAMVIAPQKGNANGDTGNVGPAGARADAFKQSHKNQRGNRDASHKKRWRHEEGQGEWYRGANGECRCRGQRSLYRSCCGDLRYAEFAACMDAERISCHQLLSHLNCKDSIEAAIYIDFVSVPRVRILVDWPNPLAPGRDLLSSNQMGWLPLSLDGIAMCQDSGVEGH
jgi:hypothetical protein